MSTHFIIAALSLPFALLAGCQSPSSSPPANGDADRSGDAARTSTADGPKGDAIPIEGVGGIGDTPGTTRPPPAGPLLQPMSYAEFSPVVDPGLGCSFADDAGALLFVAGAPDDRAARAAGAVKYGGTVGMVNATKTGGYSALVEGGIFAGSDITLNVGRSGGPGTRAGTETTAWPATLTVTELSVGDRSYAGTWSCGA